MLKANTPWSQHPWVEACNRSSHELAFAWIEPSSRLGSAAFSSHVNQPYTGFSDGFYASHPPIEKGEILNIDNGLLHNIHSGRISPPSRLAPRGGVKGLPRRSTDLFARLSTGCTKFALGPPAHQTVGRRLASCDHMR